MDVIIRMLDVVSMFGAIIGQALFVIGVIALIVSVYSRSSKKVPLQLMGAGAGLGVAAFAVFILLDKI